MTFFDSNISHQLDCDDSLPSLSGMNVSRYALPFVTSQREITMQEEKIGSEKHLDLEPYLPQPHLSDDKEKLKKNIKSKKVKWNEEEKKRYWLANLDFKLQYPFLIVSWGMEKSREPSFFKYVAQKVGTKTHKQCKCFDQNQMKAHYLKKNEQYKDLLEVALQFLDRYSQELEVMQKVDAIKAEINQSETLPTSKTETEETFCSLSSSLSNLTLTDYLNDYLSHTRQSFVFQQKQSNLLNCLKQSIRQS